MTAENISLVLPILIPWLGSFIIAVLYLKNEKLTHILATLFGVITAGSAIALLFVPTGTSFEITSNFFTGNFKLLSNTISLMLVLIASIIGGIAILFSNGYMQGENQLTRYYAFVLFFIGSMNGLVLSENLFYVFIFWEITAVCSYALISFYNDNPDAVRGGMKAFIITQLGGIGLLVAVVILYSHSGSFMLTDLLNSSYEIPQSLLTIAGVGIVFAAAAKSAQVPLHTWLPDAMEAPTPISALIHAATMVNAGVYLLARFNGAFEQLSFWQPTLTWMGAITALLAALMAAVAFDLKRVLAYSTVSQLGYMIYAIGCGGVFQSQFHLMNHAIFKALLFLTAGAIIHALGTRDMRLMGGLSKQKKYLFGVFLVGMAGLAGIPIFNGFWSKDLILEQGLEHGSLPAYIIMVLTAGLTAYYCMRTIYLVFFKQSRTGREPHHLTKTMTAPLAILALGVLTSWLLGPSLAEKIGEMTGQPLHIESLSQLMGSTFSHWSTYVTLAVSVLGIYSFLKLLKRIKGFAYQAPIFIHFAEHGFGFEQVNQFFVSTTSMVANGLRTLHTGILNWNFFLIILSGAILMAYIIWGGAA